MTAPTNGFRKRGPKVALVLGVLVLVGLAAVARGRWLEPYLRHRSAERMVLRLEKANRLAEGLLLFQVRKRHRVVAGSGERTTEWDRCGVLQRTSAGWMVSDTSGESGPSRLEDWIATGRGNRFSLERAMRVPEGRGSACGSPDREVVHQSP